MSLRDEDICCDCAQHVVPDDDCPYCAEYETTRDCPEDDSTTLRSLLDVLVEYHSDQSARFYALRMSLPELHPDAEDALACLIDCYIEKIGA